jgi:acyl-ACP thioesterase
MKQNKNIVINYLKEISGGDYFKIKVKRNNSNGTPSFAFYKPISKFKLRD